MDNYGVIISKWKKKLIRSKEDYRQILSNFCIVFAYNSGAIENPEISYHNTREIFENGKVINYTGNLRTLYEIENQKKCYELILQYLQQRKQIDSDFIRVIHKELTQGTYDEMRWKKGERPGEFKIHDYVVGKDGQGALPEDVPGEIVELCEEISGVDDVSENILKAAAYLHCKFENIHAFADGNGRVGRTLMNYYLMLNDYPPLIVYNESKDKYYRALDTYDRTGDITEFLAYMKASYEQTWQVLSPPSKTLSDILER